MSAQPGPIWVPQDVSKTNIVKFIGHVNKKYGLKLSTYQDVHQWSVAPQSLRSFWVEAYNWLQIALPGADSTLSSPMIDTNDMTAMDMFPPLRLFPNESLNITELILRSRKDDDVAIYFAREDSSGIEQVTWRDLRELVRRIRGAMVSSGVVAGDIIASVISNSVEAMVICMAALSLGAIWSSSSCDLGTAGIFDRYRHIHPKMVFADDSYIYSGKTVNLGERIIEWSQKLDKSTDKLRDVVVINSTNAPVDLSKVPRGCTLRSFLDRCSNDELSFNLVPFSHPAFILFSSGTTGTPKCMVHSSGGVALKVKTEMTLQNDVRRDDVVFQYTTTSWVMWVMNLLNLSCAGSMLIYDGAPFHPRPTILLELAQSTGVSIFGTSPRYIGELKGQGIVPRESFDLSKIRVVTSTGSTLSADLYEWFYSTGFPPRAQLISMSGGTDIAGCFIGGSPILPLHAGEIQCKALGMAVDVLDSLCDEPTSIELSGGAGELVCTQPFPSQPLAFIGEKGRERYKSSYFERFGPKIWCQGDFIKRNPVTGGFTILGRSDGALNPSGVRFGSAEIYAVTETFPEIADSIYVGQRRDIDDDERVLLFLKLRPGIKLGPNIDRRIRQAIGGRYSPRHVPKFIFEIADIQYTVNGKKCEINVKHIVNRRKAAVSGTVANPNALKLYKRYQDLPPEKREARSTPSKL